MSDSAPDVSIKVEYWGTAEFWTWEEFEYLAVGIDPYKLKTSDPSMHIDTKLDERKKLREHLRFHFREHDSLFGRMRPLEGIDFAARANVSLPEELTSKVKRVSASPISQLDRELSGAELNTHNKLRRTFLGVSIAKYGYDPDAERQKAISNIVADLEAVGLAADAKTIRARLTEAFETLNADQEEKLKKYVSECNEKL